MVDFINIGLTLLGVLFTCIAFYIKIRVDIELIKKTQAIYEKDINDRLDIIEHKFKRVFDKLDENKEADHHLDSKISELIGFLKGKDLYNGDK